MSPLIFMPALLLGMLNKRAISLKYINNFQINLCSGLSKSGRELFSYLNDYTLVPCGVRNLFIEQRHQIFDALLSADATVAMLFFAKFLINFPLQSNWSLYLIWRFTHLLFHLCPTHQVKEIHIFIFF